MNIKNTIKKYLPLIAKVGLWYKDTKRCKRRTDAIKKLQHLEETDKQFVFYLGVPEIPNLGDLAQYYCIEKWITENYPIAELVKVDLSVITDTRFTNIFLSELKRLYKPIDIIIFQSGYNTQDLGGDQPRMHQIIIDAMPDAKILMMPQTIYFQNEENKRVCSENHNKAHKMLFLARDFTSYEIAKGMFPDIRVAAFPDIVTTLIGVYNYNNHRSGVCLCTRNDGEKLYSYEEINFFAKRLENTGVNVVCKDTQGKHSYLQIRYNLKHYIEEELESYSHYDVTITDRYHGTIFSLCAGTPVIIIKTTDHKVTTGADWFKGVYDDYVFVAKDLDDAYNIYQKIKTKTYDHVLKPYFKEEYYDKLKDLFENNKIL